MTWRESYHCRNTISQSMTLTCRLSHHWDDETQLNGDWMLDHWSSINHRCTACKLLPVGSLSTHLCLCVVHAHGPRLWCAKAISFPTQVGCYSLWQRGVCGPGPTAETPFYKAVNIGYEPTAYELSVCESDSRCSSRTTKAGLKLLIFTSAKHFLNLFFLFFESLYCF